MSFQTPQSGQREAPPSLFFPSSAKKADGAKSVGRTPSGTPGFGAAKGKEQATPPSRRRSLTPGSSGMLKDTPPPPPSGSLLDSPAGGAGPALPAWGLHPLSDLSGVEDMNTSPIGGGAGPAAPPAPPTQQQQQQQSLQRDYALAGRALRDYDDTWVTVFGFGQGDVPLVLREFGKCGDVKQFGTFDDGPHVNWLHLRYANKHAAQRALLRSGDQLSTSCMVGVKPIDPGKRAALERHAAGGAAGGGGGAAALPRPARARAYQVDASAAQAAVVPLRSRSAWDKVSEFVLGL